MNEKLVREDIELSTDQRKFVMIYHDFLESDVLKGTEKLVFIALKRFADDNNCCFPSLKTIAKVCNISVSTVRRTLNTLVDKKVILRKRRKSSAGDYSSNYYKLYDFQKMWKAQTEIELTECVKEHELQAALELLKSNGYTAIKDGKNISNEKEPDSHNPESCKSSSHTNSNILSIYNDTPQSEGCQLERYSLSDVMDFFCYDILLNDYPDYEEELENVMGLLYDTLNTTKKTIRVCGEDKPSLVVIGKLLKLSHEHIIYALLQYNNQIGEINHPLAYLLTLLYKAPEQMNFDYNNKSKRL